MRYQHCIFDLYGTLVDIHTDEESPKLWTALAAYYSQQGAGYQPGELRAAYRRLVEKAELEAGVSLPWDTHEAHPEIQIAPVFQQLFREKAVDAGAAQVVQAGRQFRALSTEYIRLYGGAKELLGTLRKQGRGVWLLSNAQSLFTTWELEQLELTAYFDGIYLSSDYGVKKPDRRFFGILLQERGIVPESAVMIGNDGQCDIQGGKAVGLHTLYLHSNLSPDEPLPSADDILEHIDLEHILDIV